MKKLYITIVLFLCCFAQVAEAQNVYRNYLSNYIKKPESAVSVVHSNGYVYYFQVESNNLSITEIDPLSMNPTGNSVYCSLSIINILTFELYLNGGFENANGDFVLFGHIHYYENNNYYQYPTYVIISSGISSCDVYFDKHYGGSFTAGCDGFDQTFGEVYVLVNGRELEVVEAASPSNLHPLILDAGANPNDYFTDISWDTFHDKFIATGTAFNYQPLKHYPFVTVFDLSLFTVNSVAEYVLDCSTNDNSSDLKSLHIQLDKDNLILYHDRRIVFSSYSYDNIWLSRINNFWDITTVSIPESWFFGLPNSKILAKDMIYDSYNNRLNFLSFFNGHTYLLAQVDPYIMSSGLKIGQLGASFLGGMYTNNQPPQVRIANNSLEMFNLDLNIYNPCYPLLIAGVDKASYSAILTETYDISNTFCDTSMCHKDSIVIPKLMSYPLNIVTMLPILVQPSSNIIQDIVAVTILCDEEVACSHLFGGKSAPFSLTEGNLAVNIAIEEGNCFICEGFEGNIQYFLYDITGKLLQQGATRNGVRNKMKKSYGIYLLQATDSTNNQVVKKIVLL